MSQPTKNVLKQYLATHLGIIEYTANDVFSFKNGLEKFKDNNEFVLALSPSDKLPNNYKILQSTKDMNAYLLLINVVLGEEKEAQLLSIKDLTPHLKAHNLELKDVSIFFEVSIRNEDGNQRISINTKQPILLVPAKNEGLQITLTGEHYQTHYYVS